MFGKQEPIKRGPDGQWLEDNQGHGANRRSLYLAQTRTRSVAFLHVFDCPDMTSDNQPERFRASLPTQSLALMNNPLVMRTSTAFTQEVLEKTNGQLRCSGDAGLRRGLQPAADRERTGDCEEDHRRGAGSEGRPAPVHPGDVRGEQFPVQLLTRVRRRRKP